MTFPKRRIRESTASVENSPTSSAEPHSTHSCTMKSKKESNSEEIEGSSAFERESLELRQQTQCGVEIKSWYEQFH